MNLLEHFREKLTEVQRQRDYSNNKVVKVKMGDDISDEPAWAVFEVESMHNEINRLRAHLGKANIPLEAVWIVESMAKGHVDYSMKFAWYCANLTEHGRVL